MAKVVSSFGHLRLTAHAKRLVAAPMYAKCKAFLGAAIFLRKKNGYDFVVLHLIFQGVVVMLKGLLLGVD